MNVINILKFLFQTAKYVSKGKCLKFFFIIMTQTASFWVYWVMFHPKPIICYSEFF